MRIKKNYKGRVTDLFFNNLSLVVIVGGLKMSQRCLLMDSKRGCDWHLHTCKGSVVNFLLQNKK